jgi:hypothetical protein
MSTIYPLPRQIRENTLTASAGQTVFGPLDFILFDPEDVVVSVKPTTMETSTTLDPADYLIAPVAPAVAFPARFTVMLATPRAAGDIVTIRGSRLARRTTDVTRAGRLQSQPLETELDRLVAAEQELRRDVDRLITQTPIDAQKFLDDVIAARDAAFAAAALLGNQVYQFSTRAEAVAAIIPLIIPKIRVMCRAAGGPVVEAIYEPGTSTGPDAFRDNNGTGNWWQLNLSRPVVDIRWFNVVGDGVTDDIAGAREAVKWSGGKKLKVTGYYALSDSIALPNYITIAADNWGSASAPNGFTLVAGAQVYNGMFTAFDDHRGGIILDGLIFQGNGANVNTGSSVGVLFVAPSRLSTTDINDVEVRGCLFNGFNHNHRVLVQHAAQNDNLVNVRNVRIHRNLVKTAAANGTPGHVNTFVYLNPNNELVAPTATGLIIDVQFKDNTIYGIGICSAIQGIGGVINAVVTGNHTEGMGNNCDGNLTGYTYTFYQSSQAANVPENITVANNTGDIHHNFAVYLAGARKGSVTGNVLGGTFRPNAPASLPWGTAIALNGCSDIAVTGNTLRDNYGGICVMLSSVPDGRTLAIVVSGNTITCTLNALTSAAKPPTGIEYQGDTTVTADQELLIGGNIVKMTGDIAQGLRYSGGKMGAVSFVGNKVSSSYLGYNEASSFTGGGRYFAGNRWGGKLANSPFIASAGTSPLNIQGDEVDFSYVVAGSSSGLIVDGNTALRIDGLVLRNKTSSGACFSGIGAFGTLQNVSFFGSTTAILVAAGSIGLAKPTWPMDQGAFVQNLNSTRKVGASPNAYTLEGWDWDTSSVWQERRTGTY